MSLQSNEEEPAVSVIMPAFNAAGTLSESIESVISQTFDSWELLLIVDRHSADETLAIATAFAKEEPRIHLIQNLPLGGCAYNRNQALLRARGIYIAFLDSDDLWSSSKLEKQVRFMTETACDFSYTGYSQMDQQGRLLPQVIRPPSRITYDDLLRDNSLGCLTVMIRRARFPNIQFVDFLHEDYIQWLKLLRSTAATGLRESLAVYRLAPHSRSGNKTRAAIARWRILRQFERLPLWRAIPAFVQYAFIAIKKHSRNNSIL